MLLKVSLKLKDFFSSNFFFFHFRFLDLERFGLDIFISDLKCFKKQFIML